MDIEKGRRTMTPGESRVNSWNRTALLPNPIVLAITEGIECEDYDHEKA
jgi:hypothetical protein